MPNRFQKAIRAFKDQTSISLAKLSASSNLQVAVLKATSHDDLPINEHYVQEILQLISSNKPYASACAKAIRKRITRTRDWMVALKSLMLMLRIFQDGDPYFPREVLHATKKGGRLLNLSVFCDYSKSTPWDYTRFIRTFGLYLEERLDCVLTGKLQRRYTYNEKDGSYNRSKKRTNDYIHDMKSAMLIDKIVYWQRLLERAIATRPAGVAKDNQLVKISIYAVVRESFDLYRDISDGLTYLLNNLLKLKYELCVSFSDICVKSEKQFEKLDEFYSVCKTIAVGSAFEYPTVQIVSGELVGRLQEFSKDKMASQTPKKILHESYGEESEFSGFSLSTGTVSDKTSELGSECRSIEEIISVMKMGKIPSISNDIEAYSGEHEKRSQQESPIANVISFDDWPADKEKKENQQEKNGELLESILVNELSDLSCVNSQCEPASREDRKTVLAERVSPSSHTHSNGFGTSTNSQPEEGFEAFTEHKNSGSWELILAQIPIRQQSTHTIKILPNTFHIFSAITFHNLQSQSQPHPINHYNPFLQDLYDIPANNSCIATYWAENQTEATHEQFTINIT